MTEGGAGRFAAREPGARAHVFVGALDDELAITDADAHHLARVRRLRAGETITAADGTGAWRRYVIASTTRTTLVARADGAPSVEAPLEPALVAAVALLPPARVDALVPPLSELGVDRLVLVETARVNAASPAPERVARLRVIARESAMQCRRARPMIVGECVRFDDLVRSARDIDRVVVAVADGRRPSEIEPPGPGGAWIVLTGPEGGFTADEVARVAVTARMRLAAHVLRAETAAIAAATVLTERRV